MALSNKKFKQNLSELDSSLDNEAESPFPSFIVIESTSSPFTNLSTFIIENVISSNLTLTSVKKKFLKRNSAREKKKKRRKYADFLLNLTKFYNILVKTFLHKSLNVSKGAVRSKEISLCTIEEIKRELKKQGVTDVKRVSIKKRGNKPTHI